MSHAASRVPACQLYMYDHRQPSCGVNTVFFSLDTVDPMTDTSAAHQPQWTVLLVRLLKSAVLWTGRKHGELQSRSLGTRILRFNRETKLTKTVQLIMICMKYWGNISTSVPPLQVFGGGGAPRCPPKSPPVATVSEIQRRKIHKSPVFSHPVLFKGSFRMISIYNVYGRQLQRSNVCERLLLL